MEEQNPYAGPLEPESPPIVGLRKQKFLKAVTEGTVTGLVIALFDLFLQNEKNGEVAMMIFVAGCVFGFRHGFGGGVFASVPLGGMLFPSFLIGILLFGYQAPYNAGDQVNPLMIILGLITAGMAVFIGTIGVIFGAISGWVWTFVFPTTNSQSTD